MEGPYRNDVLCDQVLSLSNCNCNHRGRRSLRAPESDERTTCSWEVINKVLSQTSIDLYYTCPGDRSTKVHILTRWRNEAEG
ncbi:hypothetical protein M378DRAFT_159892 [Amanita muscaria Koide BX008]|uniref:Uncharacterized protein n=1 Tax=Amanita muscaria (strain Koide BX008) TaxID=946122 RepID=A0A0C2TJ11_AMAMK|nr:hypothetical protein M378DRAFT_159892 [Amanita muscaria Koide BX008]